MPSIRGILRAVMIESLGVVAVMGMLGVLQTKAGPARSASPPAVTSPMDDLGATPEERARFTQQQLSRSSQALQAHVRKQLDRLADRFSQTMASANDR